MATSTDWPEGTEVIVEPISAEKSFGRTEDEQEDAPEAIARWIAEFEAISPLRMTPEEEAEWQAARNNQKASEKAAFFERAEQLRRMWE